jgi:hypothetical protein
MRNHALHASLRAFALEAAALLSEDLEAGAELAFELEDEGSRGGPALYCYRPLTEAFIGARWHRLRALPSFEGAAQALGAGAARFLRVNGLRGEDPEPALQAMLERLYEDATGFGFPEERFERVVAEVDQALQAGPGEALVVAAVPGLELQGERLELGAGLSLEQGEAAGAPPECVWGEEGEGPRTVVALRSALGDGEPLPLLEARERFLSLIEGLRLFRAGSVALPGIGFARAGEGRWQAFELEASGSARGEPLVLAEDEGEALAAFLAAVEGSPRRGQVAWAMGRFDMGCSRAIEAEALSDHLLALRALLDVDGDSLPLRLAALCAEDGERRGLQRRVERATALERALMGGGPDPGLREGESPRALAGELEAHVRALLRDVLCGYLDPDLGAVADDILLEVPDAAEIEARDLRLEQETSEIEALAPPAEPEPAEPAEPAPELFEPEPSAAEPSAAEPASGHPEGVTPSADWQDFSAPV